MTKFQINTSVLGNSAKEEAINSACEYVERSENKVRNDHHTYLEGVKWAAKELWTSTEEAPIPDGEIVFLLTEGSIWMDSFPTSEDAREAVINENILFWTTYEKMVKVLTLQTLR